MEEKKKEKKRTNGSAPPARRRLLSDKLFVEDWTALLSSPSWRTKSPRAILQHLDMLAEYPTEFADYLVVRATLLGLPFVVQPSCVDQLFEYWNSPPP